MGKVIFTFVKLLDTKIDVLALSESVVQEYPKVFNFPFKINKGVMKIKRCWGRAIACENDCM